MNSKQVFFWGTKDDLLPLLLQIEKMFAVRYYQTGLFDEEPNSPISSVIEMENFGYPLCGDWIRDASFIMIPLDSTLTIREVPQRKGGIKFAIDQLRNQTSVAFQFGGIVKEGVILAGKAGTVFMNEFSLGVFNAFTQILKREFRKIDGFYVGRQAEDRLKTGWRLVTDEGLPAGFDLKIDKRS